MIKNQVRPAMTPEARDIINNIHETVGAETRSDSIVEFMDKHTEMEVELCAVKVASHAWERRFKDVSSKLRKEREKNQEWKVWFTVSLLTTVASLTALTLSVQ